MGNRTPFYNQHTANHAKMVEFAGWEMPLHYGSQLKEHLAVRNDVGMFDVSHMGIVDLKGDKVANYLHELIANNVDKLQPGKALYTCMLNENGGVIDDLIVYKLADNFYRVVINAGTRAKDLAWMRQHAVAYGVTIDERTDLVMLAIQGPNAKNKIANIISDQQQAQVQLNEINQLKPFTFTYLNKNKPELFIARTGYTGEDGFEVIFPGESAAEIWQALQNAAVTPCGLGARDTLRLEAGLNLYGQDMDETVTPFESNLAWTVAMEPKERTFIGRSALEKQKAMGIKRRLIGLVLDGPGIMRHEQKVMTSTNGEGIVTSGGYSPTLEKSIAFARVPVVENQAGNGETSADYFVEIRNKKVRAQMIKPPFVKFRRSTP